MADFTSDELLPENANGRRNYRHSNRQRFPNVNPRTIWNNENAANLMWNSLVFGEDESINELIQQATMTETLCKELVESPFEEPPEDIYGPINLGYAEANGNPAGIFPWEVHTLIVGASGKGKSTLNKHLMRQHIDAGIPTLIIDFENEYPSLLNDNRVNVLGVHDLKWNPLEVPPGMDPILYRQVFSSVFSDQLGLLTASKGYLLKAIDALYKLYGVYDGSNRYPSIYELSEFLTRMLGRSKVSSKTYAYAEVCINRCESFFLSLPDVLDCSNGMPLHLLAKGHTILQLHGVDFEYQSLLVCLMLSGLCCHRIANGLRNNPDYRLAIFIDEAQRVFDQQKEHRIYEGIPTISQLVAQVRKYNMMMFVSAQQPSLLASSIKANSFTKIQLALGAGSDIIDMSMCQFLDQDQTYYTRKLDVGQAVVKLGGRWHEAFIIEIPNED